MKAPLHAADKNPLQILIAEDNEMNQLLINMVLSEWNMDTHTVANGQEAIELIKKESFDLILMDMEMPVMDGYEAIGIIRAMQGKNARLPIISLSAHDATEEVDRCLAAGADAYISKPFDQDELYETIQRLTRSAGGTEEITD